MSEVAYKPLSVAEQIFKDLVWTPAIKLGEATLEGMVPALALPVIKQVDEFVLEQIADWTFNQIIMFIDVTAIKFVNAEHQAAFERASVTLKIIAHDKGLDSPDFKKARDDAKLALSKFVHFGS